MIAIFGIHVALKELEEMLGYYQKRFFFYKYQYVGLFCSFFRVTPFSRGS